MPLAGTTLNQALVARIGANHTALRRELASANRTVRAGARSMSSAFRMASRAAKLLGIAVAGIGIAALKMASDFQTAMAEVSTLLDVGIPEMRELSSAVKELSIRFGGKLTDEARALYQTFSAGANILRDNADAIRILEVANKAAVAGITDVATSVEAIMRVMNAYTLTADDATRVSDLLFQIVRKGVTTFGELAPQIGQVAGTAAAAGVSFEEMAAIIATATTRLPIEQVITGANQLLLAFVSRTEDTEKAAKALGVQFDASALAAKGVQGVLEEVFDAMGVGVEELKKIASGGEDVEQVMGAIANRTGLTTEVISALFPNVRALRVALAIMAGEGEGFAKNMEAMAEAGGATETAFQKMSETFGFLSRRVRQEVSVAFVELGETLFPVAKEIAGAIGTIARRTREWISANQELIRQNVEAVFTAVVRGVGIAAEKIVQIVQFFRQNPLAGEFGLVGLVFLGPAGAATLTFLGLAIDKLAGRLFGATDVSGRLSENIIRATQELADLSRKARGEFFPDEVLMTIEQINEEIAKQRGILNMNMRTLMTLGETGVTTFDEMLASVRDFAQGMQGFDFGDLFPQFSQTGGEGGDSPIVTEAKKFSETIEKTTKKAQGTTTELGKAVLLMKLANREADTTKVLMGDILVTLGSVVAAGITEMIVGFQDAAQAAKDLGKAILRFVVRSLLKAVIFTKILSPIFSHFELTLPGLRSGGMIPKARSGLMLPDLAPAGFGGGIPIMAHPGEAVLTKRTVANLGGSAAITSMNRGDMGRVGGDVRIEAVFPDASQIPEPTDYGMIASKPQVIRLMSEIFRQVEYVRR